MTVRPFVFVATVATFAFIALTTPAADSTPATDSTRATRSAHTTRAHRPVCARVHRDHEVVVDLSRQRAWLCRHGRQALTTPVTTGAVQRGTATPTGRWQVYDKVRNTTLHPAAGGSYPVHFWMPYSGPYGLHDSPWQHFPYGSDKYRRHGSHGCVHVPESAMRFLYRWAPVGTTVLVRR